MTVIPVAVVAQRIVAKCTEKRMTDNIDRQYVSRKEGGRGLVSIKDGVDTSIKRLEDCIKRCSGRLITENIENKNGKKNKSIKRDTTGWGILQEI